MFLSVKAFTRLGIDLVPVTVEVNVSKRGLSYFDIVGLPSKSINESKHRIRLALQNSGLEFPPHRIVVNLSPSDIPKEGTHFDLAIASAIVMISLNMQPPEAWAFHGELSLDGSIKSQSSVVPAMFSASENKITDLFCGVSLNGSIRVYRLENLKQLIDIFIKFKNTGILPTTACVEELQTVTRLAAYPDLNSIVGNYEAKRALQISLAGNHHVLLTGFPGIGKTMLCQASQSLFPALTDKESQEVSKIHLLNNQAEFSMVKDRILRSPHHSISYSNMIGGAGKNPLAGEITLAHQGVLLMDEFQLFKKEIIESLRTPLEDGFITFNRQGRLFKYPSKFILWASTNPCDCGYLGHPEVPCKCSLQKLKQFRRSFSGPIMDRIDLHVFVTDPREKSGQQSFDIPKIKSQIEFVRSQKPPEDLLSLLDKQGRKLLDKAKDSFQLSMRAYFKTISIARTISLLEATDVISSNHIAESLSFRPKVLENS